jgi:hypothetical protein
MATQTVSRMISAATPIRAQKHQDNLRLADEVLCNLDQKWNE